MTRKNSRAPYDGDLRQDLLDAAIAAVASQDPAQLSLRAIARELGVSHAAPKNHFADKTALFTAIAVEGFTGLGAALDAAQNPVPDGPNDGIASLERAGQAYVAYAMANPGCFRVMWRNELLNEEAPALKQASDDAFASLIRAISTGQAAGWASARDTRDVAVYAWSLVHGVAQLLLDGPLGDMDGRSPEEVAAVCTDLLVAGLRSVQ
jgi:AcrR family transcriptional regulator